MQIKEWLQIHHHEDFTVLNNWLGMKVGWWAGCMHGGGVGKRKERGHIRGP